METKVNLAEKLSLLDTPFQPGIVGTLNDYKLAVVKARGEFVWHKHDDTDDFFLVLSSPSAPAPVRGRRPRPASGSRACAGCCARACPRCAG